jgi:hypothetical protein
MPPKKQIHPESEEPGILCQGLNKTVRFPANRKAHGPFSFAKLLRI